MTAVGPSDVENQQDEAMASCDMRKDCAEAVTHIGSKGYIYCAKHAVQRRESGYERTRAMRPVVDVSDHVIHISLIHVFPHADTQRLWRTRQPERHQDGRYHPKQH